MTLDPKTEPFRSFGRCQAGASIVYRPRTRGEVREVFAIAKNAGRRVCIRGGGHSFDGQALHTGDTGNQIILSSDNFEPDRIEFDDHANTVTLGAGVPWGLFVATSINTPHDGFIRLPGTLQTGRHATAGGTLAGDCLSRFSGTQGKESRWIESFRMVTTDGQELNVSANSNPDLFNAVIGGHGYLGFVSDVTYKLVSIEQGSCAQTTVTRHTSIHELVDHQLEHVRRHETSNDSTPLAISAAWFTDGFGVNKGGVFASTYAKRSSPQRPGYPIYGGIDGPERYWTEVMARVEPLNVLIHEFIFAISAEDGGLFENDLSEFLFFMDGNTVAKQRFETTHPNQLFPIVQQTFVVPTDQAEPFTNHCLTKTRVHGLTPTEWDMLPVQADDSLMSGNYQLDGFAISMGYERVAPDGCLPPAIPQLLRELSVDCHAIGGRLHMVKNLNIDPHVFRAMYSPQIETFEEIKRTYDPDLLLQNAFSDTFFKFKR